jgi:hypothetical protein
MTKCPHGLLLALLVAWWGCRGAQTPPTSVPSQDREQDAAGRINVAANITERLSQFAEASIDVRDELLPETWRPALLKLVEAAAVMDQLYLSQVSPDNARLGQTLEGEGQADALAYFKIMYGPWDRLEGGEPFIGSQPRPAGVSFYPPGLTAEAFQAYVESHPDQREALTSYFTVIRQEGETLQAVPYSQAYREPLTEAARLLEEAAELAPDERLQRYLRLRAQAFRDDDYFESDVAWLQLGDCPVDVVIGPYEVYEDGLLGLKASFEAFVTVRDPEASAQLARISELGTRLERALPMEERHRNFNRGSTRPISVVYLVTSAGDTKAGVQTLAFNLPNDERVREEHGYKLVLLRNVMEAKYSMILEPIARQLLHPQELPNLSFAAFLNNTLLHETAHGLGPGTIRLPDGTETDVNRQLRDLYSVIEEAKADIVGLFSSQYLINHDVLPRELQQSMYSTFLAGFFRSVRFGAEEAHGQANMIQFNYLKERQAFTRDDQGRYRVNYDRIAQAVQELARELLTIEGNGDYDAARAFVARYGAMDDELQQALGRLEAIPVDIRPTYPAEARLQGA